MNAICLLYKTLIKKPEASGQRVYFNFCYKMHFDYIGDPFLQ
jgi:hypothetical protein